MEPSDLLPGLGKMLEQRLGKMGYYLGTVVVLSVAAFLILLPFGAVAAAVLAMSNAFYGPIEANTALRFLYIVLYIIVFVVGLFLLHWAVKRMSRKLEQRFRRILELVRRVQKQQGQIEVLFQRLDVAADKVEKDAENLETGWDELESHVANHGSDHSHRQPGDLNERGRVFGSAIVKERPAQSKDTFEIDNNDEDLPFPEVQDDKC